MEEQQNDSIIKKPTQTKSQSDLLHGLLITLHGADNYITGMGSPVTWSHVLYTLVTVKPKKNFLTAN